MRTELKEIALFFFLAHMHTLSSSLLPLLSLRVNNKITASRLPGRRARASRQSNLLPGLRDQAVIVLSSSPSEQMVEQSKRRGSQRQDGGKDF